MWLDMVDDNLPAARRTTRQTTPRTGDLGIGHRHVFRRHLKSQNIEFTMKRLREPVEPGS
jgi:hypothetical protein